MSHVKSQGATAGVIMEMGVAVGMLFATKTGKEAREQIADNVKNDFNRTIDKGKDLTQRFQDKLGDVKDQANRAADASEQFYRDARSENL
jgi:gas vesicle protein